MNSMCSTTARTRLAVVAAAGLLLAGCSGGPHPSAAAVVGDQTVSMTDVDAGSQAFCDYVKGQLPAGQSVPMSTLRLVTVQALATRAQADQVADEYDVTPSAQYRTAYQTASTQIGLVDGDLVDTLAPIVTAGDYYNSIAAAIGSKQLAAAGHPDASYSDQVAAGGTLLEDWKSAHDFVLAPVFDTSADFAYESGGLSVPVSDSAKAGVAMVEGFITNQQPDFEAAADLPPSQRCGG